MIAKGVHTAIITPFDEAGAIDEACFVRLIAYQESAGVNGVVVAGSTGEGPSLSAPEKVRLYELACQARGALQVIAGIIVCSLDEARYLARQATKLGCDGLMVAPPFYFSPPEAGLIAFYKATLEATPLPVILYNIPQRTRVALTPALVSALLDYPNLIGIKDSSGEMASLEQYLQFAPRLKVWVGEEKFLLHNLQNGGAGTISGLANVYPYGLVRVWRAYQEGKEAEGLQALVDSYADAIDAFPAPVNFKYTLRYEGFPPMSVRLPLQDLTPEQQSALNAALAPYR